MLYQAVTDAQRERRINAYIDWKVLFKNVHRNLFSLYINSFFESIAKSSTKDFEIIGFLSLESV